MNNPHSHEIQGMEYLALATDYDGTLASDGHVEHETVVALQRLRTAGMRLALVTGRQLPELRSVFPALSVFDVVVAENGALLYWPNEGREQLLGEPPPASFLAIMSRRNVQPFSVGNSIFATWRPHEVAVRDAIAELGIDWHVILNKRAVMALPKQVNKATGLAVALNELKIAPSRVVGVGDAENDVAFLRSCGLSVAVANALPMLKQECKLVTEGECGTGVRQLIESLLTQRDSNNGSPAQATGADRDRSGVERGS